MFVNILKAYLKICEYSRNNPQNDDDAFFDQVEWLFQFCWLTYLNSLSILFLQCVIFVHGVKVRSLLALVKFFVRIFWQLKRSTWIWKCTRCTLQMSYLVHASDFHFKNFCKLATQAKTIKDYQNRVWLWLSIVWEIHKLTLYQIKSFLT